MIGGITTPSVTSSPILQMGASLLLAADACGIPFETLVGDYSGFVAMEAEFAGYYVDPGAVASEQVLADAVAQAGEAGEDLFVVVLASEPGIGTLAFADSVMYWIGCGTVLVVSPESVGFSSYSFRWTQQDLDDAVVASLNEVSTDGTVRIFVETLTG